MNHTATPISVHCSHCGEYQVQPSDAMGLMVNKAETTFSYAYTCIYCDEVSCPSLYYSAYKALRAILPTYYCGEIPEMMEEHSGPPISNDDVLAFHEALSWWR